MEIGERIKARREELGMSQDELARLVGYKWRSSINKVVVFFNVKKAHRKSRLVGLLFLFLVMKKRVSCVRGGS